jgi:O-antigen ligase
LATWRTPAFRATLPPAATDVWSHSGYLDMALGGGVFAVILFAAVLVTAVRNAGSLLDEDDNAATAWPLAIVLAVALAATQESFFIGNHFYWALFVAAGATASRLPSRRAIERAHAPEPTPPPAGASSLP